HACGTRCRHEWNVFIVRQPLPHIIISVDQTRDALGNAIPQENNFNDFLASYATKRCCFRQLPDTNVAANPRNHVSPRPYGYREVEGGNNSDDTQGMPLLVHPMAGALTMHGKAVKLTRQANGEIAYINHLLYFPQSFLIGFAHFIGHKLTERC